MIPCSSVSDNSVMRDIISLTDSLKALRIHHKVSSERRKAACITNHLKA